MRFHLVVGSLVALVALVASACSSGSAGPVAEQTAPEPTLPAPSMDASQPAKDAGAGGGDDATVKPANDCKLAELTGVTDVSPTFVTNAAPSSVPPSMTGGTLKGEYRVDGATVFLPSGSAGLADPRKSTGTINAWAVFDGTNYRLYLKADFTIATVAGPQAQGADTASQGGFTVSGAALLLDHACDTAIVQEADYSFTDNGGGRATILIKTPSPYGDTFLQLDAARIPR